MKERILIVEDDPDTLEMLASYFRRFEYQVVTAPFGQSAIDQATAHPPQLVILDIRLPDVDGYEVCRRLRQQERTRHVPIIFLTEKRERESKITGLELGAEDYITKPFDIHELRLRVENALRRASLLPLTHPVTGLAGRQLLLEHLRSLSSLAGWTLLSLELEGLDAFSDQYGFVARDDLLRAVNTTASSIMEALGLAGHFLAHPLEEQFILLVPQERAEECLGMLRQRLPPALDTFYPFQARQAGAPSLLHAFVRTAPLAGVPLDDWQSLAAFLESLPRRPLNPA